MKNFNLNGYPVNLMESIKNNSISMKKIRLIEIFTTNNLFFYISIYVLTYYKFSLEKYQ